MKFLPVKMNLRFGDHMKMKRCSLLVLFLGIALLCIGIALPAVFWQIFGRVISQRADMAIIGGADAATYQYLSRTLLNGLPNAIGMLGISMILSAGFCLLFSGTVRKHCTVATSAIALGLSATGALGLVCVLVWSSIVAFDSARHYPIEFPVSIMLGLLCLCAFLILFSLYFKVREKHKSIPGLLIDVFSGILYLPAYFLAFSYLYEIIA